MWRRSVSNYYRHIAGVILSDAVYPHLILPGVYHPDRIHGSGKLFKLTVRRIPLCFYLSCNIGLVICTLKCHIERGSETDDHDAHNQADHPDDHGRLHNELLKKIIGKLRDIA